MIHDYVVLLNEDKIKIAESARVDSFAKIEGGNGVIIEDDVHIASFCHILGGGVAILKKHSAMSSGAKLITGSNTLAGVSCSAASPKELQVIKRSFVMLKPFSIVFTNAIVYPGVTIGMGSVLSAGAIATKDIPDFEIWAGVPAVKMWERDPEIIDKMLEVCYDRTYYR